MVAPTYQPRDPSGTVLYQVVAEHLETFLAGIDADPTANGLPSYVRDEFQAYLQCGILAHGFLRLSCDTCPHQMLLAFKRPCKDARALQKARVLSLVCRQTHGRDGSAPGRAGNPLGGHSSVGRLGPHSLALLDGGFDTLDGPGAYDYPPHDPSV
jgi:hypothetical protein